MGIIGLTQEAYMIISLIGDCNKISGSNPNQEIFKVTNTMIQEMAELGKAVNSKNDFENLIDALFKIVYEGSGNLSRIPEKLRSPDSIGFTIKHLRNEIRHDLEHGDQKEVLNKRLRFSKILEHYTDKKLYESLAVEDFSRFQNQLFLELQRFMEALKRYLILDQNVEGNPKKVDTEIPNITLKKQQLSKQNLGGFKIQRHTIADLSIINRENEDQLAETVKKIVETQVNAESKDPQIETIPFVNVKSGNKPIFPQASNPVNENLSQEQSLIIAEIREFYRVKQRPSGFKEPGFQKLIWAAEKYFGSWENALDASHLEPYIDFRKTRTLSSSIRQILNNNPLPLGTLAAEIRKIEKYSDCTVQTIMSTIFQTEDILSIGAHGHKLYFMKGQEPSNTVYPILNRLDSSKIQEELLRMLVTPMTKNEIREQFAAKGYAKLDFGINRSLNKLWRTESIWRVRFVASAGSGQKVYSDRFVP